MDKVYNTPGECNIQDIAIALNDINSRLNYERQNKSEENKNLIVMMGKLIDSRLDPLSRKLESITETQEAQEEQIKQKD